MNELNAIPMNKEHIDFVIAVMTSDRNKAALHLGNRSVSVWREILTKNLFDPDEANFIIQKGSTPVAWLKIHGMQNKNNRAGISMLVVHEDHQRQGIGNFAVRFAEDYIASKGFTVMSIHTTEDNKAAINCYTKLGYTIFKIAECTVDDGVTRQGVTFYRDHLDAIRMSIDGVYFRLKEAYDFSFLSEYGKVFRVFDGQSSGSLCFGVEKAGKRYFLKFAGAKTVNDALGNIEDTIMRLKFSVPKYKDLKHPRLINFIDAVEVGGGYMTIFDWFDGESCGYPQREMCKRFLALPVEDKMLVYEGILEFHAHVAECGYVAIDFNDQATLYNFDNGSFAICDIDTYAKQCYMNGKGGIWGDPSLMSPEESRSGAIVDEISNVYAMGATAFVFFAEDDKHSREKWSLRNSLYEIAKKAVSEARCERYQTIAEYIIAWNKAKGANNIMYRQLSLDDLSPDMLKYFNRYQEVKKKWEKKDGEWVLINSPHTLINWDITAQQVVIKDCTESICSGGCVWGAFDHEKLIGFCAISCNPIGSKEQYMQLRQIHVSYEYRGKGVGRKLFSLSSEAMKNCMAKKLYIVANPSEESQAFYRAMGCIEAEEIIPELYVDSYDVHMEYVL